MAFKKRDSMLAFFLLVAVLGDAVTSALVRREAPDTTLSAGGSTGTEVDIATDDVSNPSSLAAGEETEAPEETDLTEDDVATGTEDGAAPGTEGEDDAATGTEGEDDEEEESTETDDDQFTDVGFQTGIVFGSPFVTLQEMQKLFYELERTLHRVFENALNDAAQNPDKNTTTTAEEVTVGGHKYLVNRTIITGGDEDSAVIIRAISMVPSPQRRKRAAMELL